MPDPISSAGIGPALTMDLERGGSRPSPHTRFAEHLRGEATPQEPAEASAPERSPAMEAIGDAVRSIARGQRLVDGAIRRAGRGGEVDGAQLLALQAGVYRYTQELELASKLVDKATGALKQTLQSQQ